MASPLNAIALTLCATLLIGVSVTAVAQSAYYRWTDAQGNQMHSDRPPPAGVDYEKIESGKNPMRQAESNKNSAFPEPSTRVETKPDAPNTTSARETEKNPELCRAAKENLRLLDSSARIRLNTGEGEAQYLSDKQRAVQREEAVTTIEKLCE
jgi:hypothetical protein